MTVLVTGANGALGRAVIAELQRRDVAVRGTGRRSAPENFSGDWAIADLLSGSGLDQALSGITAVVHCASNPLQREDDVRATNPASNEELFSALSNDFVKNGFDIKRLIREAVELHLAGMREDGQPIPEPSTEVDYVEAPAA